MLSVIKPLLNASQCKRAICQGCQSFVVMVNAAVAPHTDVANDCASVTSNNTRFYACCASGHCSAAAFAVGPDPAFTLRQKLEGINSQFADACAEPSELPSDRGTHRIIPLDQPLCKRMFCLSPSELVGVKRHMTELLQKQPIVPSVSHTEAPARTLSPTVPLTLCTTKRG